MGDPNGARYNPPLQADSTRQRFGLVRALTYPVGLFHPQRILGDSRIDLLDGRSLTVPLAWYPRLLAASDAQRDHFRIIGGGGIIHWPDLDEHLSSQGLLADAPVPDVRVTHGAG